MLLQNKYQTVRFLGRGGFGSVYEVVHTELGARFAIKELYPESSMSPTQRQAASAQFNLEARILANLDHPMLPNVVDFFTERERDYLVMEFVPGDTLEELLVKNNAPLAEYRVLTWTDTLCDALIFLHSQNPPIIHRDLKPSNIKMMPDGRLKLLDFGIAKLLTGGAGTGTAARAVTPPYAPLEQYGTGTNVRSDIYALGVTMYQLLTNRLPPEAPDRANQRVAPPRQLNPALTSKTEALVLRAMAEKQADRYASAAELQQAIHQANSAPAPTRAAYTAALYAKFQANMQHVPVKPAWIVPVAIGGVLFFCLVLFLLNAMFPLTKSDADAAATRVARVFIQTATAARRGATATRQNAATSSNPTAKPTQTRPSQTAVPTPIQIVATHAPTEIPIAIPTEIPTALPIETTPPTEIPTPTLTPRPLPDSYDWVQEFPANSPSARGNYGTAYDSERHVTVLLGGGRVTRDIGETFEWDGKSWTRREFFSARLWRSSPIMVYDTSRNVIVMFGGLDGQQRPLNDTWEYDGITWRDINTAHAPPSRSAACAAFDERLGQVVLFGGDDSQDSTYADTWVYDGTDWIQQFPSIAPPSRRLCAMAYDSARGAAVLFGGWAKGVTWEDTWEWDGTSWVRRAPQVMPPARGAHALVYHPRLDLTLLFGGDAGPCSTLYQDTWSWDGVNWQELDVNAMGTHSVIAAAYDSRRDTILLFGGWSGGNGSCDITNETWEYVLVR